MNRATIQKIERDIAEAEGAIAGLEDALASATYGLFDGTSTDADAKAATDALTAGERRVKALHGALAHAKEVEAEMIANARAEIHRVAINAVRQQLARRRKVGERMTSALAEVVKAREEFIEIGDKARAAAQNGIFSDGNSALTGLFGLEGANRLLQQEAYRLSAPWAMKINPTAPVAFVLPGSQAQLKHWTNPAAITPALAEIDAADKWAMQVIAAAPPPMLPGVAEHQDNVQSPTRFESAEPLPAWDPNAAPPVVEAQPGHLPPSLETVEGQAEFEREAAILPPETKAAVLAGVGIKPTNTIAPAAIAPPIDGNPAWLDPLLARDPALAKTLEAARQFDAEKPQRDAARADKMRQSAIEHEERTRE